MGKGGEALVACSDRNMGIGMIVWDLETGDRLMHIPTCASPSYGLLCLRDQFLVASQINRHGSVGNGAIFTWQLNKPNSPIRSYPIEAIGPIACTTDGMYLVGGASSGNAYIWEVADGTLLKKWCAHNKSLKCMIFSSDDSFLVSGSEDGVICVWSMLSLLDMGNSESLSSLLHCTLEHSSAISGLLTASSSTFISSSLDATCKAWDLVTGTVTQTLEYSVGITAIAFHLTEQFLFAGSIDGRIFINVLHIGLVDDDPSVVAEDYPVVLEGHKGSITALTFSKFGLVSASEDCTICLWDAISWTPIRKYNFQKGAVTNIVLVPYSLLLPLSNRERVSYKFPVSLLEKCPLPAANLSKGTVTLLHSCSAAEGNPTAIDFRTSSYHQILEMEEERTPAALQMQLETSMERRIWATKMTKRVMEINKVLQSRLLDMMQIRLERNNEQHSFPTRDKKKIKFGSLLDFP